MFAFSVLSLAAVPIGTVPLATVSLATDWEAASAASPSRADPVEATAEFGGHVESGAIDAAAAAALGSVAVDCTPAHELGVVGIADAAAVTVGAAAEAWAVSGLEAAYTDYSVAAPVAEWAAEPRCSFGPSARHRSRRTAGTAEASDRSSGRSSGTGKGGRRHSWRRFEVFAEESQWEQRRHSGIG